MKREDIIKAFEMRLDGKSLQEIGDHFNVSREYIRLILDFSVKGSKRGIADSVYPNITKWCIEHGMSAYAFNKEAGVCRLIASFYAKLRGRSRFTMEEVKKILDYTGMNFDEAFAKRAGDE